MRSPLDNPPPVQHQDLVGCQDRAQPVGDHQARPPGHHPPQRFLDQRFRLAVEVAGGFVQHQDARVFENDARNRSAASLRRSAGSRARPPVVAVRQSGDEGVDVGRATGGFQLVLRRVELGVAQVGADGVVEQVRLLGDDADLRGERVERDIAQVDAIEQDASGGGIVQAGNELGHGGFARPRSVPQRHQLPRLVVNRHIVSASKRA